MVTNNLGADGWYYESTWDEVLTNITHDTNCVDTADSGGSRPCIPCGFAPFQTGDCATPPITAVSRAHHLRTTFGGVRIYEHTWADGSPTIACACGRHGCVH
jgi:hypothetical protein